MIALTSPAMMLDGMLTGIHAIQLCGVELRVLDLLGRAIFMRHRTSQPIGCHYHQHRRRKRMTHEQQKTACLRYLWLGKTVDFLIGMGYAQKAIDAALGELR